MYTIIITIAYIAIFVFIAIALGYKIKSKAIRIFSVEVISIISPFFLLTFGAGHFVSFEIKLVSVILIFVILIYGYIKIKK